MNNPTELEIVQPTLIYDDFQQPVDDLKPDVPIYSAGDDIPAAAVANTNLYQPNPVPTKYAETSNIIELPITPPAPPLPELHDASLFDLRAAYGMPALSPQNLAERLSQTYFEMNQHATAPLPNQQSIEHTRNHPVPCERDLFNEYVNNPYNFVATDRSTAYLPSPSDNQPLSSNLNEQQKPLVPQPSNVFQSSNYFGSTDENDLKIPPGSEMLFSRP